MSCFIFGICTTALEQAGIHHCMNEDRKHVGELGTASGSESTVLVSRAHIYSEVVRSEQKRVPLRIGASSVQYMKKHSQNAALCKNNVIGLYFSYSW